MAEHENRPGEFEEVIIPDASVSELNELGIKDLPRAYYLVVGANGRQPVLEEHVVDNSDEALGKLPSDERALVKEFLLGRQLFMNPQDRWIHVGFGGLGSAEEAISETDLTIMARLASELRRTDGQYYKHAVSAHPNIIYANGYGDAPIVGDVIIPGRTFHSYDGPARYELSQVSIDSIGLCSAQKADWQQNVRLFRPAPIPVKE